MWLPVLSVPGWETNEHGSIRRVKDGYRAPVGKNATGDRVALLNDVKAGTWHAVPLLTIRRAYDKARREAVEQLPQDEGQLCLL